MFRLYHLDLMFGSITPLGSVLSTTRYSVVPAASVWRGVGAILCCFTFIQSKKTPPLFSTSTSEQPDLVSDVGAAYADDLVR